MAVQFCLPEVTHPLNARRPRSIRSFLGLSILGHERAPRRGLGSGERSTTPASFPRVGVAGVGVAPVGALRGLVGGGFGGLSAGACRRSFSTLLRTRSRSGESGGGRLTVYFADSNLQPR